MSAKPADPSAFGRIVADEAVNLGTVGDNVSHTATTTDFGVSDEIAIFKDLVGSSPNPPGADHAADHISEAPMANPTSFTFNPLEQTFTFSNEHLTITAETNIPPPPAPLPDPVLVTSVTLEFDNPSPHDVFTLPVADVVVPPHVVEHVFDVI
jgi:hypothetical protein